MARLPIGGLPIMPSLILLLALCTETKREIASCLANFATRFRSENNSLHTKIIIGTDFRPLICIAHNVREPRAGQYGRFQQSRIRKHAESQPVFACAQETISLIGCRSNVHAESQVQLAFVTRADLLRVTFYDPI